MKLESIEAIKPNNTPPTGWHLQKSYAGLPSDMYSATPPTPVANPQAALLNYKFAHDLGLYFSTQNEAEIVQQLSGNSLPPGSHPIAQAYMGHQFGYLNMLGDGRAILLGEHITPNGRRVDIQLKGAGPTPYSRRGDGRATLSACLREYIISEAMHGLGIATSRSLAVVKTGEPVYREQMHEGGVLTRVMSSHIRVGTFEFATRHLNKAAYGQFLQYVINRHYPQLAGAENPATALLQAVMEKQADLIVEWMRVGFIHGVMNTDNMSIASETFDYGPCAFMNRYNPATVFSSIDTAGRYAFANQPSIAQWNLAVLASALIPLIDDNSENSVSIAKGILHAFPDLYGRKYRDMMQQKIGITQPAAETAGLINDLLQWMEMTGADYTNTFVHLMYPEWIKDEIYEADGLKLWKARWQETVNQQPGGSAAALAIMKKVNPVFIPRNHLVEEALDAATLGKDNGPLHKLLQVVANPYEKQPGNDRYRQAPLGGDGYYKTFCNT
ncbi:MAG: YdiU family protein [Chitinophagaceae bacterium]|nr:YdiU family protein [Chitinophagaceae bacterium]